MSHDKLPNQYKQALESARRTALPTATELHDALDKAITAMTAGAWVSSKATEFEHALTAHQRTLRTAAGGVKDEFNSKISDEPEQVGEHDWRATWYRTSRMIAP